MKIQKFAAALCAALLLGTAFAGCAGSKPASQEPVSITIWHYYNGVQKEQFDRMVTEYNETAGAQKGIVVEAYSQGNVNDLPGKVLDAINHKVGAQETPDVFASYSDTVYAIDQLGMVADISNYLTPEEQAEYVPAYLEEGRFHRDGGLLLFPIAKSSEAFVINQTDWNRFAQATGADEAMLSTWEGIAAAAKAYYEWTDSLTEAPNDGKAFFGRDAMANYYIIGSLQLGVELFQVEDGEVTLNLDKKIFRRLWDNYYVPYVSGYFSAVGKFRSDDVKTGDIIALVGSNSGAAYFPSEVTDSTGKPYPIQAKVLPLPNFAGANEPCAVQQGAGMAVIKTTEAKEAAAVDFLKWFTDSERNIQFSIGSGYLPVKIAANNWEAVETAYDAAQPQLSGVMREVLKTGIETVNGYRLYTTKPFENGLEARMVVDTSMQQAADAARDGVLELLGQGVPYEEAVARYTTDESFESWFDGFRAQLERLC